MRFILYCESSIDNINEIVKAVENTKKLSIKNVYVSVEDALDKMNEKTVEQLSISDNTVSNYNKHNKEARTAHIAHPFNPLENGWAEYDKISNMPTL